jgi:hypothetical protein
LPSKGERDIYGIKSGRPYAEASVAVERLKPAPTWAHKGAWTRRQPKVIVNQTYEKIQDEQEAKDSTTDKELSSDELNEEVYNIECIKDHRSVRDRRGVHNTEYLVHFEGYATEKDEWLPATSVNAERRIKEYYAKRTLAEQAQPAPSRRKRKTSSAATEVVLPVAQSKRRSTRNSSRGQALQSIVACVVAGLREVRHLMADRRMSSAERQEVAPLENAIQEIGVLAGSGMGQVPLAPELNNSLDEYDASGSESDDH